MLIPAILKADEIKCCMQKYFYSDDMTYWTGYPTNYLPDIAEQPDDTTFQYAVVDRNNRLLGYISYKVDWYSSNAYNFGIFSFVRGTITFGRAVMSEINKLINEYKIERIEWRAVDTNPAVKSYDRLCERYNGNKHTLHDTFKDRSGKSHDSYIYEIFPSTNYFKKSINGVGKWKAAESEKQFICSNCKGLVETAHYCTACYYRYCPNCGVKMVGDKRC